MRESEWEREMRMGGVSGQKSSHKKMRTLKRTGFKKDSRTEF